METYPCGRDRFQERQQFHIHIEVDHREGYDPGAFEDLITVANVFHYTRSGLETQNTLSFRLRKSCISACGLLCLSFLPLLCCTENNTRGL